MMSELSSIELSFPYKHQFLITASPDDHQYEKPMSVLDVDVKSCFCGTFAARGMLL